MSLTVTKDQITPTLASLARDFPTLFPKAMMDLGARYRKRMQREIRAGSPAGQTFAPLSEVTLQLRAGSKAAKRYGRLMRKAAMTQGARVEAQGKSFGFGGMLPDLTRYEVAGNPVYLRLGFVTGEKNKAALAFQQGAGRPFTRQERAWLHRRLANENIPHFYSKPFRYAVSPFMVPLKQEAVAVVRKSIERRLQSQADKLRR